MAHFFTFTPKKKAATDIDFIHLIESTGMKILVATEKPFAKEAVDGIRRIARESTTYQDESPRLYRNILWSRYNQATT